MSRRHHKGYSVYKAAGLTTFNVTWTDGSGRRRTKKGIHAKAIADELGRAMAAEADRVRHGLLKPGEVASIQHGKQSIDKHLAALETALLQKGNTTKHAHQTRTRCQTLLSLASVKTLGDLDAGRLQESLKQIAEKHSPQTAVAYFTVLRIFVRWCIKTDRLLIDPTKGVSRPAAHGQTFKRHAFSSEEIEQLLAKTETIERQMMSGKDRAMFYRVMIYTGFRVGEALSLSRRSFDLDAEPTPTVTVEAQYSKHRRRDVQMIRRDIAELLRPWLMSKSIASIDARLFKLPQHAAIQRMFHADCAAAGVVAGEGEILGMHSFRRYYITAAVRAGGLRAAQELARHSSPTLTSKYADMNLKDLDKALSGLPPAAKVEQQDQQKKAGA